MKTIRKKLNVIFSITGTSLVILFLLILVLSEVRKRREQNLQLEDVTEISCDSNLTQYCSVNSIYTIQAKLENDYVVYADIPPNELHKSLIRKDFIVDSSVYSLQINQTACLKLKQVNLITFNNETINYENYPKSFVTLCDNSDQTDIDKFVYPLNF